LGGFEKREELLCRLDVAKVVDVEESAVHGNGEVLAWPDDGDARAVDDPNKAALNAREKQKMDNVRWHDDVIS
jgi:hypothetical protein